MKIETKYNIGDSVFLMDKNKCITAKITGLRINVIDGNFLGYINHQTIQYEILFGSDKRVYIEDMLFPTKEELLKSL